jgi:hypothetical protein
MESSPISPMKGGESDHPDNGEKVLLDLEY